MPADYSKLEDGLNNDDSRIRLESLKILMDKIKNGEIEKPKSGNYVNNHIHTSYSFSPYSPSKAVWMAYQSGLETAGIMDHDSVSGALEFVEAGKITGIATTTGMECRTDFSGTSLKGRTINHPDQVSMVYAALHGIPHSRIEKIKNFILPYLKERDNRNIKMVDKLNGLLKSFQIQLDYENEVVPLSKRNEGGSVTERHILFALSKKMVEKYSKGKILTDFLKNEFKLTLSRKIENYLLDKSNHFYEYDLLGLLKGDFAVQFYINADKECPDIRDFIRLADETGSIAAYAYLGDVGDSVTGDKKSQKFEDDYLDHLFEVIKEVGFHAVTYMPSRNTIDQLRRVKSLCDKFGLFQISGEDINSPRQSFICEALEKPEFRNLIDSTWALIGHELSASENLSKGFTSRETLEKYPDLNERIKVYKEIGLKYKN